MKNKYFSLVKEDKSAVINIFGDITSYEWKDSDVSYNNLSKQLDNLTDVDKIDVYINSYGGEVAEGLAIYNALKRHKAKIITHVDGFACSIASVIFMAGDERIMPKTSCLMIHNPWTVISGNSKELRKQADDLDTIAKCSINAYLDKINISEEELNKLLDEESWISPIDALDMGFATLIEADDNNDYVNQSIKSKLINNFLNKKINDNVHNTENNDNNSYEDNEEEINNETKNKNEIEEATKLFSSFFMKLEEEILK